MKRKASTAMTRRHLVEGVQGAVAVAAHFFLSTISFLAVWAFLPILFGWLPTAVMSGSMEPTLKVGEVVVAQPVSHDQLLAGIVRPGHVVLAENPLNKGTLFTHRVMSIRPDGQLITKGDNNGTLDPEPLPLQGVKGIERMKVPLVGFPIYAIHSGNPAPLLAFIGVIALAAAVIRADNARREAATVYATRTEARKARESNRGFAAKVLAAAAGAADGLRREYIQRRPSNGGNLPTGVMGQR